MPKIKVGENVTNCKLVLFDLDGTLIDKKSRNRALAETRYHAVKRLMGEQAATLWAQLSGVDIETFNVDENGPLSKAPRKEDVIVAATAIWLCGLNWFKAKEVAAKVYSEADEQQLKGKFKAALLPGVLEALMEMRKAGLLMGIATNGSGEYAKNLMEANGIGDLFSVYVGSDMVNEGKPEPDMIIEACSRLSIDPSETVYVGDELVDAIAATRAGCRGVIIVSRKTDVSKYTQLVANSVADIQIL